MPETHDESKRNRRTAKRILAIGLPLVVIAATGVGYAYWTSSGTGSGSATAEDGIDVTVTVGAATGLVPGGHVDVPVALSNPSTTTSLRVSTLTLNSVTEDAAHSGCTAAVSGITTSVTTPAATTLAPSASGVAFGSVRVNMANTNADQDACKGVQYTVAVSVA
jgi:flagellar basal body-associated protein FliL